MAVKKKVKARAAAKPRETAETLAHKQREISVSEFFLKNRHLLGFDSPRKALLTAVKEAVDNALDACEEAGVLPELSVEIRQTRSNRFLVTVTDNGPGIVRAQLPRIFASLLYGSKFHRLRMSRGQQGIGISAAVMYGQLTTGKSTHIVSKTRRNRKAHQIDLQIDTEKNKPITLGESEIDWCPSFAPVEGKKKLVTYRHGTSVSIELEGAYVRGRLSVDEYLKQCAVVNPHLQLHYRVILQKPETGDGKEIPTTKRRAKKAVKKKAGKAADETPVVEETPWVSYVRVLNEIPEIPNEIKPHPHGVELGMLMQMLKGTSARTLRAVLCQDFSRVGSKVAGDICNQAGLNPKAKPTRIAHKESEALFKAISETKLMRPPTDCLSPIGEEQILAGLKKEIRADFYPATTRPPAVYRGNPFQIEIGLAYAKAGDSEDLGAEEPVRLMRFANRVPLLYMGGACAMNKASIGVNWKTYGLSQPRGALPVGPMVVMVHIASVWVPFTSESKEAVAHYPEILREISFALQECGRKLSVYLKRRQRQAEALRKREYMSLYIPHLALGLKEMLELSDRQETVIVNKLNDMLEKTHLEA
jgi:DNA topoisomerase-6 subunit B